MSAVHEEQYDVLILIDEAQHWFVKHNVTALRRLQKSYNNRVARATGANIVTAPHLLKESDVGTKCGLFEVRKIGDEYVLVCNHELIY